jgi:hypothetical protein
VDCTVADEGLGEVEPDEALGIHRRAELFQRNPGGEMRRGGREQIPAVERARDRLERVLGIRELVRLVDALPACCGQQQTVVGSDVEAALSVSQRKRSARAADTRVHDREMHPDRHEVDRVREHERALENRRRRDPVRDVDDLRLRGDALHDAVARADEVVLQAEVTEERDEHDAEGNAVGWDDLLAQRAWRGAATGRAPLRLAAETHAAWPDPDERRRRLERQRSRHHGRSIFGGSASHDPRSDLDRARRTSSAVSRCKRVSFAAMIAT